jgi:predicted transcriptional regulator
MFISEEQLNERLNSPRNLANRFRRGNAEIYRGNTAAEKEAPKSGSEKKESGRIQPLSAESGGITFKQIKRPGNCRPWLSSEERTSIAISAAQSGSKQKDIAVAFGVKDSTVSDIVNGTRRIQDTSRSADEIRIDAELNKVREKAIENLMSSLGLMTPDKVSSHSAKDISMICYNMSKVMESTITQEKATQQINLVVYTPELRNEKSFKTVEV